MPRGLRRRLPGHGIKTVPEMGWGGIKNGKLLALADYFIGKKLNGRRPNLMQTSQTIITRLGAGKLPGFTTAKVKNLGAQRQAWVDAQTKRGDAETAARSSRAEAKTMLKSIKDRKIAVQLAFHKLWQRSGREIVAQVSKPAGSPTSKSAGMWDRVGTTQVWKRSV